MKGALAGLLLIASAGVVSAQPIYGHPQKKAYASAAEYPTVDFQSHWPVRGELNDLADGCDPDVAVRCAHLHVQITRGPLYMFAKPGDVLHVTFSATLHQFPGGLKDAHGGWSSVNEDLGTLRWDATGSSKLPTTRGNPDGDVTFTGTMDLPVDLRLTKWWFASIKVVGQLDNGDQLGEQPQFPIWFGDVEANPRADRIIGEDYPLLNSRASAFDAATGVSYSNVTAEFQGYIPLMAISTPWFVPTVAYSYNTANLPMATTQVRRDLDFHHGVPGTILFSEQTLKFPGNNFATLGFAFDPTGLTPGPHKWALIRQQPDNGDQTTSLLVVTVTVDPNAPPSPVGPNVPPPVITPPPPAPAPADTPVVPTFTLSADGVTLRVCVAAKCVALVLR